MSIDRAKALKAGQKFLAKGQLERAIAEFRKVVEADPTDARSLLKLGDLYTRQGANKDAAKTYRRVAEQYAKQGFFLKAVAVYKQILKLDSADLEATEKLAEMYEMLSLTSDALTTYEQVIDAHTRMGHPQRAVEAMGRLANLDPENVAARIRHAETLSKADRIDEAADAFRAGADVLKAQGRLDDYIKVTERLLFHSHEDVGRARELAAIYIERGHAKAALPHLQTCFKADPRDVATLSLLSQAFALLGQTTKAGSVLKEMIRIHATAGDSAAEASVLRRLVELEPDDVDARQRLAALDAEGASEAGIEIVEDDDMDDLIIIDDDEDVDELEVLDAEPPAQAQQPAPVFQPSFSPPAGAPSFVPIPEADAGHAGGGLADVEAEIEIARLMSECEVFVRYGLEDKVLLTLNRVIEIDPTHVAAREKLKQVLLASGATQDAVAHLVALADHARERGDEEAALGHLEEAQTLAPDSASVTARLAELGGGDDTLFVDDDEDDVIVLDDGDEGEASFAGMLSEAPPAGAAGFGATPVAAPAAQPLAPAFESLAPLEPEPVPELDPHEPESELEPLDEDDEPELLLEDSDEDLAELGVPEEELAAHASSAPAPDPPMAPLAPALASTPATPPRLEPPAPAPIAPPFAPAAPLAPPAASALPTPAALDAPQPDAPMIAPPRPAADPEPAAEAPAWDDDAEVPEEIADVLEEVEFYLSQELPDEAREAIADAMEEHGEHPALLRKLAEIDGAAAEPEPQAAPEPEITARAEPEDRSFELAQKLAEQAQPTPQAGPVAVEDVLSQFKEGVKNQVDKGDTATHYDLGIAYMEMGLHAEAIDEFKLCLDNGEQEATAHHMIGLSHVAKGEMAPAIEHFLAALNTPGSGEREELDLWFEIGNAYELLGRANEALLWYEQVEERDATFRGVAERIERLGVIKSAEQEVDEFDEMFDNMILKD